MSVIIFLISIFTGLLQPVLPLIEYYTFQESIIELLCENKDRTDMDCDGVCYLTSQIEKQQNEHSGKANSLINVDDLSVFCLHLYAKSGSLSFPATLSMSEWISAPSSSLAFDIFHPPKA